MIDTTYKFAAEAYFCDADGPHQGQLALKFRGTAYMSPQDLTDGDRNGGFTVAVRPAAPGERTELSARSEEAGPEGATQVGDRYAMPALIVAYLTAAQLEEYKAGATVTFGAYLESPAAEDGTQR